MVSSYRGVVVGDAVLRVAQVSVGGIQASPRKSMASTWSPLTPCLRAVER